MDEDETVHVVIVGELTRAFDKALIEQTARKNAQLKKPADTKSSPTIRPRRLTPTYVGSALPPHLRRAEPSLALAERRRSLRRDRG